jgi:hypothetical protein
MRTSTPRNSAILALILLLGTLSGTAAPVLDAITFAVDPDKVYVPLEEAGKALGWHIVPDQARKVTYFHEVPIPAKSLRALVDGTSLITLRDLRHAGAHVKPARNGTAFNVGTTWRYFTATVGPKQAEVNLAAQRLRGWQGSRLVLDTRISSGRGGRTPAGSFVAGPYKSARHFSSRYNNAAMPWSVQVNGHIFIHGFTSVPKYPASHGCIRVPLNEGNPARFFYEWVDKGTPIKVVQR